MTFKTQTYRHYEKYNQIKNFFWFIIWHLFEKKHENLITKNKFNPKETILSNLQKRLLMLLLFKIRIFILSCFICVIRWLFIAFVLI